MEISKARWLDTEIQVLKNNYNEEYEVLGALLPNRTLKSIKNKIKNMNLPRELRLNKYSKEEDDILKSNNMETKEVLLTLLPNKTWDSIVQRMYYLKLNRQKGWTFWTNEEVELLKNSTDMEDAMTKLPNRTKTMIYSKAKSMDIELIHCLWTANELDTLRRLYSEVGCEDISEIIGRPISSIYGKAHELGLVSKRNLNILDRDEIIKLYEEGLMSLSEIAEMKGTYIHKISEIVPLEKRRPVSYYISGEKNHNWKGGTSSESEKIRKSNDYRKWRKAVFERDNYTCQCCSKLGGNLNVHHINNFAEHDNLRFDVSNGIVLCEKHHLVMYEESFHSIYGSTNNDIHQLQEYFDDVRDSLSLPPIDIIKDIIYKDYIFED